MGSWNEYSEISGVVFDEIDDAINAALGNSSSTGSSGAGAPPPKPEPAARPPVPAGATPVPGNPNRAITSTVAYTYNGTTNQWDPGLYPPSRDERNAVLGTGTTASASTPRTGTTGSTYTPFPTSNQRRDAEQTALGAIKTPPGNWVIHPAGARAVDPTTKAIYTRDPGTGNWTTNGQLFNPRYDGSWVAQAMANPGSTPPATPSATPTPLTGPLAPTSTLSSTQGPTFSSPLFSQGNRPGVSIPYTEGMIRGGNAATNALNSLNVQSRSMQMNGPVVQGAATLGNGRGNIEFTRGGAGAGGTIAPDRRFDPLSFYVPSTYDPRAGRDTDGVFRPVDVGYNISDPNLDTMTPGGSAVMTLSGPQTVHGVNGLPGFNPNAMAASNIGMAYGRNFSELDPVSQMVATAALMDEREKLEAMGYGPLAALGAMTAAAPGTWEGYGPDGGTRGFDKGTMGAGITTRPLGGQPDLVTNETIYLVGESGKVHGMMGEDNADRDRQPDPEAVYFRDGAMHIVPLDPPQRFADGTTNGITTAPARYRNDLTGIESELGAPLPGWSPITPTSDPTAAPTPTPAPGPTLPPQTPTTPPTSGIPTIGPIAIPPPTAPAFDVLNPNILAPWQAAQQELAMREAARNSMAHRWRAANVQETVIPWLQGDVPTGELAAGVRYDPSGMINSNIQQIIGAQDAFKELGPVEDISDAQGAIGNIGQTLDAMQRIRDLQLQRVGAEAQAGVPSTSDGNVASWQAELEDLAGQMGQFYSAQNAGIDIPPSTLAHYRDIQSRMNQLRNQIESAGEQGTNALDKVSIIDAQIKALEGAMPLRPDGGRYSEAELRTELARQQDRVQRNDKRIGLSQQVQNLAKIGVPKLNGPIRPVVAA